MSLGGCPNWGNRPTQRARTAGESRGAQPDAGCRGSTRTFQAGRVGWGCGTPWRRIRSHTITPPTGPRTITAIEYFQDQRISGVIIRTMAQKASQIIPWIEPVTALAASFGLMIQK